MMYIMGREGWGGGALPRQVPARVDVLREIRAAPMLLRLDQTPRHRLHARRF